MTIRTQGVRAPQSKRASLRAGLAATALITLAGATAGCTTAGASATTPPSAGTVTPTAVGAAAPIAPASTGIAATSDGGNSGGSQAQAPACSPADLSISTGAQQGAAGQTIQTLIFNSSTTCSLDGYPGVELTTADGGKLDAQRTTGGTSPTQVTLGPSRPASALVTWEHFPQDGSPNVSTANCPGYGDTALLVTAPNQTTSAHLPPLNPGAGTPVCWGFEVSPVVPGTTGR